jgi:putative endonuclease
MTLLEALTNWWRERTSPPPPTEATLGQRGEDEAERFLRQLGYKILARGSRNKLGELDLVALDGQTIVFVEVKTRRSTDRGHPADAVDQRKQARITRLALAYLKRHRLLEQRCRFDVIAITWPDDHQPPKIEHFKHAFEATGRDSMYS